MNNDTLKDPLLFKCYLPRLLEELEIETMIPEAWAMRSYCLRKGKDPAALFNSMLRSGQFMAAEGSDWKAGNRDRLGPDASPDDLDRKELIAEVKAHVGKFLPGGHEVLSSGIENATRGFYSWRDLKEITLRAAVKALREGREGSPPDRISYRQFKQEAKGGQEED